MKKFASIDQKTILAQIIAFVIFIVFIQNATAIATAPNVGIDFKNETTSSPIPNTIEYSLNPTMASAVSGTGTVVLLLPGNTYYFRYKSTSTAPASAIQTLVIPERPVTPSYSIDYVNETTVEAIKGTDEFSSSPAMTYASSGNEAKKNLYPGQTLYFRTKYTSNRYKSLIQTLVVPVRPATPQYSINFTTETTNQPIAGTDEYSSSSSMSNNVTGNGERISLTPGATLYFRTKSTTGSFKSLVQELVVPSRPEAPVYNINFNTEKTEGPVAVTDEYSSSQSFTNSVAGPGFPITIEPGSTLYFRTKATNSTFKSGIYTLVAPNRPAIPFYSVNYSDETTNEVVVASDEFSFSPNMSNAVSGVNQKIALSVGRNLYFRVKSTENSFKSAIFFLTIPSRSAAPFYSIDFQNETTNEPVVSTDMYSTSASLSDAIQGSGQKIQVTPGQNLYFFRKATPTAFKSQVLTLIAPERPTLPSYSIDYIAESTKQSVPSSDLIAFSSDMANAITGTGTKIKLLPGKDTYFQTQATSTSFKSEIQLLSIPARPAVKKFSIDYYTETVLEQVSSDYEYSSSALMAGSVSGNGKKVTVVPGENMYFRVKATDTTFYSTVYKLVVPERPKIANYSIDYVNETTREVVTSAFAYGSNSDMGNSTLGNNKPAPVVPGETLYFWSVATESGFRSELSTLEVPERPSEPSSPAVDISQRALDWELGSLYSDITDYEYSYSGTQAWKACDVKPLQLTKSTSVTAQINLRIKASNESGKERFSSKISVIENPLKDPEGSEIVIRTYPNPMTDLLIIDADPTISARPILTISDSRGNVIITEDLVVNHKEISVSHLPQGLYVITVTAGSTSTKQKILKR